MRYIIIIALSVLAIGCVPEEQSETLPEQVEEIPEEVEEGTCCSVVPGETEIPEKRAQEPKGQWSGVFRYSDERIKFEGVDEPLLVMSHQNESSTLSNYGESWGDFIGVHCTIFVPSFAQYGQPEMKIYFEINGELFENERVEISEETDNHYFEHLFVSPVGLNEGDMIRFFLETDFQFWKRFDIEYTEVSCRGVEPGDSGL